MKKLVLKFISLSLFFINFIGFSFSLTFTSAPKISKIGGVISVNGLSINTISGNNIVFSGKTKTYIVNSNNSQISFTNPVGQSANGGLYISNYEKNETVFHQNITQATFSGGNAGNIINSTFEIQTRVLTFQPSAMLLTNFSSYEGLDILLADSSANSNNIRNLYLPYWKKFNLDSLEISEPQYSLNLGVTSKTKSLKTTNINSDYSLDIVSLKDNNINFHDFNSMFNYYSPFFSFVSQSGIIKDFVTIDINQDKKLDIAFLTDYFIYYAKNNGNITTPNIDPNVGSYSYFNSNYTPQRILHSFDINNDEKQEIIIAQEKSFSIKPQIVILEHFYNFNTSITSTYNAATITIPSNISQIVTTDLNNDSFHDIILNIGNSDSIAIIQNIHQNTSQSVSGNSFATPIFIRTGLSTVTNITTGDVDGDAIPEIIVAGSNGISGIVKVFKSNFQFTSTSGQNLSVNSYPTSIVYPITNSGFSFELNPIKGLEVADINSDGKMDILAYSSSTTNGALIALINQSCKSPEVGIINQSDDGRYACGNSPVSFLATYSGEGAFADWKALKYISQQYIQVDFDISDLSKYKRQIIDSINYFSSKISFETESKFDTLRTFIISVDGTCGAMREASEDLNIVFEVPTITSKNLICGQVKLSDISTYNSRNNYLWTFNGEKILTQNIPSQDTVYIPILKGKYQLIVENPEIYNGERIEATTQTKFELNDRQCVSNEIDVSYLSIFVPLVSVNLDGYTNLKTDIDKTSYRWFLNGKLIVNQTSAQLKTNYNGNYEVEIKDNSSCVGKSNIFNINNPNYLSSATLFTNNRNEIFFPNELSNEFKIYPNPTQNQFTVEGLNPKNISKIIISDINGKISSTTIAENNSSIVINTENIIEGIYQIQVYENEELKYFSKLAIIR